MSNKIKTKLTTIDKKLDELKKNILKGKREIAYAIKFNGIETVNPYDDSSNIYDTFKRYAELIRRLKSANSMTLEFRISGNTDYQRSIVLPLYFGSTYAPSSIDNIAQEIINNDKTEIKKTYNVLSKKIEKEIPFVKDKYNNDCIDGDYIITNDDIQNYLSREQQEELFNIINNPTMFSIVEKQEKLENPDANYNYTVDWGDGTQECQYTHGASYEENKLAMWHTYTSNGVYDVTINGNFRRIYSSLTYDSPLVVSGEYVKDKDGSTIYKGRNYAMYNSLIEVVAWGNTLLNNVSYGFCNCRKLVKIPMYDTTNSFEDVTDFSYMFFQCQSLTEIPFNRNTNKGLFSGCAKALNFTGTFQYCTGMKGEIPIKLIDGCKNVKTVSGMFAYSNFSGNIPNGLLKGLTSLTDASEMFAKCKLTGEISPDLFKDCPNITNICRLFYGCTNVTGTISRDFIGGLSKLTEMRQAFYNCRGITKITNDAFYNIKSDGINCRDAFKGCGITEIPTGLLESLTGKNLLLERMFDSCTSLTSISQTALESLKVSNARGMFGGCTSLTSKCPNSNSDWNKYETIKKWYGVFANTNLSDINNVPIELGGDGQRRFSDGKVGMILLQDKKTYVEIKDYTYNENNKPIGIVYADEYLDSTKLIPTLKNSEGNVVNKSDKNVIHKIFITTFNDITKPWISEQKFCEDVTTITDTSDVNVSYNLFKYSRDTDNTQIRSNTRYNGEAYSYALRKFIFEKGYADNIIKDSYTSYVVIENLQQQNLDVNKIYYMANINDKNLYEAYIVKNGVLEKNSNFNIYLNKIESSRYPAITHCNTYNNGVLKRRMLFI